jgi:hypothetical protein
MPDLNPLAFFELLIVAAFAIGWFILEKVANSYDRNKNPEPVESRDEKASTSLPPASSGHSERQHELHGGRNEAVER